MRIVKSQAVSMLQAENALLEMQRARCWGQVNKFETINFGAMSGMSVAKAQEKLRMQAAIGTAHLSFYDSLISANVKNMSLVHALPETSPGVLDTSVAQDRLENALRQIRSLQKSMQDAIQRIRRVNEALWRAFESAIKNNEEANWSPLDEGPVRAHYQRLIECQRHVANANKIILTRASEYDRDSLEVYCGVEKSYLRQAVGSSDSFIAAGNWGNTSWVGRLSTFAASGGIKRPKAVSGGSKSLLQRFLAGELKEETSLVGGDVGVSTTFMGVPTSGTLSGDILGLSLVLKPYGKGSKKTSEKDGSSGLGGEVELEVYGAKGKAQGTFGLIDTDSEVKGLVGTISGTLGASLFSKNGLSPSLEAGGKLEGSVLASETNMSLGTEGYDIHATAQGNALTAASEAKVHMGVDGMEARVGAEAYAATGELTGGLTLFGVKVDASVEGKAAGAGAKAGGKIETSSAEGELGIGLGVGLGVKVKVDWSGLGTLFGGDDQLEQWLSSLRI